jgi:AcrR family transcriptional regulator
VPGEVRTQLLAAARDLFTANGFAGTSTRQIADHAGVSEALLFRHFGTKAKLFELAMLEPYNQFISDTMDLLRSEMSASIPTDEITGTFITGLYKMMREHRELFLALIAAQAFDAEAMNNGEKAESELTQQIDRLTEQVVAIDRVADYLDPRVTLRAIVGMVIGLTVLDDWLLPVGKRRPSDEHILNELIPLALYGVSGRRPGRERSRRTPAKK